MLKRRDKSTFAAIIRFVRHLEATGPAKDMIKQIRRRRKALQGPCRSRRQVRNHRHDALRERPKNESAPAPAASDRIAEVAFKAMKRRNCGSVNDQHAKNKKVQAGIIEFQL